MENGGKSGGMKLPGDCHALCLDQGRGDEAMRMPYAIARLEISKPMQDRLLLSPGSGFTTQLL
jgi:hypothetical protein